jgi:hypothetical protein
MLNILRAALMTGIFVIAPLAASAQSPIPESRVPGFGGQDTRPGSSPGGSPSASGSAVGSNVGAGASAAPTADVVTPSTAPSTAGDIKPPTGTSGSVTITR